LFCDCGCFDDASLSDVAGSNARLANSNFMYECSRRTKISQGYQPGGQVGDLTNSHGLSSNAR
jgi:hypothetical protein